MVDALKAGQVDLANPVVTVELLRLNAVVGVRGTVSETGQLTRLGVTCALCHSSVDDSFAKGIGKRMDGWANTDLNVGAIVALSPARRRDQGGVQRLGARPLRSAPSRIQRKADHSAQQSFDPRGAAADLARTD